MKTVFSATAFPENLYDRDNAVILETARIDRLNTRSFAFLDPAEVLAAFTPDGVETVLSEADRYVEAGWYAAGYLAYEAGYTFEDRLVKLVPVTEPRDPLAWFGIYAEPLIRDFTLMEQYNGGTESGESSDSLNRGYEIAAAALDVEEGEYLQAVGRIRDYIASGDTYQINYTLGVRFFFSGSHVALYRDLKHKQAVSYAAYIRHGETRILSLSPEMFFRRSGDRITTRPMKGTMRRGRTPGEDRENSELLRTSIKNRAENVMIVDLLRNDIGTVARTGSVAVTGLFDIERYETLFQMTSTVEGTLSHGTGYCEIFRRLFPCGSVTGAPKIRSMEIIRELEKSPRGVYTGAIGYMGPGGEAAFNVAIRTPVIRGNEGVMGIGSGIVWDSDPVEEYRECRLKADFFFMPACDFELLETLLYRAGRYRLLDSHIRRMAESAGYFDFGFDAAGLAAFLSAYARGLADKGPYRVRVLCDRRGRFRAEHAPLVTSPAGKEPGRVAFAGTSVDSGEVMLYHKTTRREMYNTMYELACKNGLTDVLFRNERGEITEGAISNVFIRREESLLTPPVTCGLLGGLMRHYILGKLKHAREEVLTPDDIREADEIFLCNSVRGVMRVRLVDEVLPKR